MLGEAKQLLGTLDGKGSTIPNPELLLRPLQRREALRSSSLEGTYASPEELLLFEMKPRLPTSSADRANSWLEVFNYGRALSEGWLYLKERPLTIFLIRQLHSWLLQNVRGERAQPGEFRTAQVHIGAERRFIPPPPERVQECLDALMPHLAGTKSGFDPLVWCYLVHYQFEAIHPFMDGNGRVGRLLLALMTWLGCDLEMPWLYMSPFFERYKDEYIGKLFNVSADGQWEEWIRFCLVGTIEQARDAIRRCDLLNSLKEDMRRRVNTGSARLHQIVDSLFVDPMVTVPQLRDKLQVTYPTAKSDVKHLVNAGILAEGLATRPQVYFSPEIFRISYSDQEGRSDKEG